MLIFDFRNISGPYTEEFSGLIRPRNLNGVDRILPFSINVEELIVDGVEFGPADVPVSYDAQGRVCLELGDFFPKTLRALEATVQMRYRAGGDPFPLVVTKRSVGCEQEKPTIEARLSKEPLALVDSTSAKRFEAVLFAPPQFISKGIQLHDCDGVGFSIDPFSTLECSACLVHSDINAQSTSPILPLAPLLDFLTFVKGCHCGFGNLFAYDEGDVLAFRLLGFTRVDMMRENNWFDIGVQERLPEIFLHFSTAYKDTLTRKAIRQAIDFYRASNASRQVSVEMAIIAAHSALEAIVHFILEFCAGWSSALMKNSGISFSDKHRSAAMYYGIDRDLLAKSPELLIFSKSNNNIDVFEVISRIRNKLVHQDTKASLSGIQLHEAWLISQWLVEVLLFGVIGYRGEMNDRRVYNGWRGTTCEVPLSR